MKYIHLEKLNSTLFLPFRIICKVGPQKLLQLFRTRDPAYFDREVPYGVEEDCDYRTDPYLAVYHMFSNLSKADYSRWYRLAQEALLLASVLERETSFFQEVSEDQKLDFKKFVATLILHHYGCVKTNPMPLYQFKDTDSLSLEEFYRYGADLPKQFRFSAATNSPLVGWGIYPVSSLANHSCDPNVFLTFDFEKGTVITATLRALKAGETLYGCYEKHAAVDSVEERQNFLLRNYHFKCRCVACTNGWDPRSLDHTNFCCSKCSRKFSAEEKSSLEFKTKCVLKSPDWKCGLCGNKYSPETLCRQSISNNKTLGEARRLFSRNCPREAIQKIKIAMEHFQFSLCPPHDLQVQCEFLLPFAMALVFDYAQ